MSNNNNNNNTIYYFLIGNLKAKKEIGTFIDNSDSTNDINDFNDIVNKSKEILHLNNLLSISNKKNKIELKNHNLYYTITNNDTFYLAAVRKNSLYCKQENLIFELMEDIEHQGIKKLVDRNGDLTNVGRQNLKFSIEKYHESNKKRLLDNVKKQKKNNFFFKSNENNNNNIISENNTNLSILSDDSQGNKISIVNNSINELTNEMKVNVQNMINNVTEMNVLENKSDKIKNLSNEFKNNSNILKRRIRFNNIKLKFLFIIIIIIILIIVFIYLIK